jgi:4-hydroxy-4-methyl-2-oxoglutarate aldolase
MKNENQSLSETLYHTHHSSLITHLSKFSAATLCEALGNKGNLPSGIKPISPNMKICGPAYTIQTMPRDNILLHRAYAYANQGFMRLAIGAI